MKKVVKRSISTSIELLNSLLGGYLYICIQIESRVMLSDHPKGALLNFLGLFLFSADISLFCEI